MELTDFSKIFNFSNHEKRAVEERDLKGSPADPNNTVLLTIYNLSRKKSRVQNVKVKWAINRELMYTDTAGNRRFGKVLGVYLETGALVVMSNDGVKPDAPMDAAHPDMVFLE